VAEAQGRGGVGRGAETPRPHGLARRVPRSIRPFIHSSTHPLIQLQASSYTLQAASQKLRAASFEHRPSSIEHPVSSIQHPAIHSSSFKLQATRCKLQARSCEPRASSTEHPGSSIHPCSFKLQATRCKLQARSCEPRASSTEHPVSSIQYPASAIQKSATLGRRGRRRLACRRGLGRRRGLGDRRDLPRRPQLRRVGALGHRHRPGDQVDDGRDHHDQDRGEHRRRRSDDQPDDQAPHALGLVRIAHRLIPLDQRTRRRSMLTRAEPATQEENSGWAH